MDGNDGRASCKWEMLQFLCVRSLPTTEGILQELVGKTRIRLAASHEKSRGSSACAT